MKYNYKLKQHIYQIIPSLICLALVFFSLQVNAQIFPVCPDANGNSNSGPGNPVGNPDAIVPLSGTLISPTEYVIQSAEICIQGDGANGGCGSDPEWKLDLTIPSEMIGTCADLSFRVCRRGDFGQSNEIVFIYDELSNEIGQIPGLTGAQFDCTAGPACTQVTISSCAYNDQAVDGIWELTLYTNGQIGGNSIGDFCNVPAGPQPDENGDVCAAGVCATYTQADAPNGNYVSQANGGPMVDAACAGCNCLFVDYLYIEFQRSDPDFTIANDCVFVNDVVELSPAPNGCTQIWSTTGGGTLSGTTGPVTYTATTAGMFQICNDTGNDVCLEQVCVDIEVKDIPTTCAEITSTNADICAVLLADPSNPLASLDCDRGGIDNATECAKGQDPLNGSDDCGTGSDKDNDGVPDAYDSDSDNDGILDIDECIPTIDTSAYTSENITITNPTGPIGSASGLENGLNNYGGTIDLTLTEDAGGDIYGMTNISRPQYSANPSHYSVVFNGNVTEMSLGLNVNNVGNQVHHVLTFSQPISNITLHFRNVDRGMWTFTGTEHQETLAASGPTIVYTPSTRLLQNTTNDIVNGNGSIYFEATDPVVGLTSIEWTVEYNPANPVAGEGYGFVFTYRSPCDTDTDGDGLINSLDLDSDNDGIPDAVEACGDLSLVLENCSLDDNGSGSYPDNDGDGCPDGLLSTVCESAPIDTDMDGIPDFLDLDSDGDGCADSEEAGTTSSGTSVDGYVAGSVDDCGLLKTGISGSCPIPSNTNWIEENVLGCIETCQDVIDDGLDICTILINDPNSPLATLDCDGGGVDNQTECDSGDDPTDSSDDYDCDNAIADGINICGYITANPTSNLATLDCDDGGVDNATECANGDDPTDPADDYDCDQAVQDALDICAYIALNPASEIATLDCDGGGVDNATECTNGDDPTDAADDYDCNSIAAAGVDICSYIASNPGSNIASLDCDAGGVDNQTECNNGDDPTDPVDDFDCEEIITDGMDICAYLTSNPSSVLATLDCDGGGVDNGTECANGDDPTDPADDYDCASIVAAGVDICGYIAANPTAAIATLDCDMGGVDNATECDNGDDPTDPADDYDCDQAVQDGLDICAYIAANPTSEIASLDCDGGSVDNATECANGDDPTDPADDYDCDSIVAAGVDICSYIAANPGSNIASLDCDKGGVDNQTECANGDDPTDPADDADCATAIANGEDICAIIAANPTSVLASQDCDGGGIDNATECANGDDPTDPSDDYDCDSIVADGVDICGYIAANPTSDIATLDCDSGGVDNATECANGDDPTDPDDDYDCDQAVQDGLDICAYIALNPTSELAGLDCDAGGVNNATECTNGDDPTDPADDYDCDSIVAAGVDICGYISANPTSDIATLDCDGGGVSNAIECNNGDDPTDPADDLNCDEFMSNGGDICAYLALNPVSVLASLDCDGGGIDNATECANGDDPSDPADDYGCDQAIADGVNICGYITANPTSAIATLDCDRGGVDNQTECANGDDPTDPVDDYDCAQAVQDGLDICVYIAANPTSQIATLDCDAGGVDNATECANGDDPTDPDDDFDCAQAAADGLDLCIYIAANPTSEIATLDCDAGGIDNATECANGNDPNDQTDDYGCDQAIEDGIDICAYLTANPNAALASLDCDGGGIDNAIECANGEDPSDPSDDCESFSGLRPDICTFILDNPSNPIALADCDGGGISNIDECTSGQNPSDPSDDCDAAIDGNIDICAIMLGDANHPMAALDCDGGGIDNITECNSGENPTDPSDDCMAAEQEGVDICALIAADPTNAMAGLDCDGGGIINSLECDEGGDPFNGADDCSSADAIPGDFCTFVIENPTSDAALADCDGGGVNNYNECINGEDPFDNTDDCQAAQEGNLDICTYVIANPTSLLATSDCDNGGVSNYHECISVEDPLYDPDDDCATVLAENLDICALLIQYPNSTLHTADCDGGGIDNATECANGADPHNPDDDSCENMEASGYDICTLLIANPGHPLASEDCDGGGINNLIECDPDGDGDPSDGNDPFDESDDCESADEGGVDICAIIAADPTSVFATQDCDEGGMDNTTECENGGDPHDPDDDSCANAEASGYDLCALLIANPTHPLATQDCDGGGIDNLTECTSGENPFDPADDCTAAIDEAVDICALIAADPSNVLASADCDNGGLDNQTECDNGGNPGDPDDDSCANMEASGYDICALITANPNHPLASDDCDAGGVLNSTECNSGGDPFDPLDDCGNTLANDGDICAIIAANPSSPIATLDCDGGGIDNATECASGNDPSDPSDDCDAAQANNVNLCLLLSGNPNNPLATEDCDGGGLDNITECENQEDPFDSSDECNPFLEDDIDMCTFLAANPGNPLADADCDDGGITNGEECASGGDPLDPIDDSCDSFAASGQDLCAFITANPTNPMATFDCDGGGIDNATECGTGDDPLDPSDDCASAEAAGTDICALITVDPTNPMATLDCDGGGVDNATECASGDNPFDPSDDCQAAANNGVDICALIAADPSNGLATADCDGGGVDNATECGGGFDPFDEADDCDAGAAGAADICAIIAADPSSPIASLDCDGGGIDNATECANGQNPFDSGDDCDAAAASGFNLCAVLLTDPNHPLANLDCDGGGIINSAECASGENPFDSSDDCKTATDLNVDVCALIGADPTHPMAAQDCDGGGVNNIIECFNGNNPLQAGDDCDSAVKEGIDICALIALNPTNGFASQDCDGGGVDNATECLNGADPNNPSDDCDAAIDAGIDVCAMIAQNPNSPLATADCDGGGIDNATECSTGGDPTAEGDDYACDTAISSGADICALIAADPSIPIASLDCDGGGIDNATECASGENPLDPSDDCQTIVDEGMDICALINGNAGHPLASIDCDGGGIDNLTECINHTDPTAPGDDCTAACAAGIDIHVLIGGNPNHPMAQQDCDGGGVSNFDECIAGQDACDPLDDCVTAIADGTICALVAANPNSPMATADCDGGGIDNATECANGGDPGDPTDDCGAVGTGADLCALINNNPNHPFADFDCDGGGVTNIVECQQGANPLDPTDDCTAATDANILCAIILANPSNPLAQQDCDGGGVINITECQTGEEPGQTPEDDCQAAIDANLNLCALINNDPTHPLAQLDCDGGGVTNFIECQTGEEPGQTPEDDCQSAVDANMDLCVLINNDPSHPFAQLDCDGGGVTNIIECQTGEEPGQTPGDDCQSAINAGILSALIVDVTNPLHTSDCDGDGTPNGQDGDPLDPCVDATVFIPTGDCDGDGTPNGEDEDPLDPCVDFTIFDPELCEDNTALAECAINTNVFLEGSLIGIGIETWGSSMRTDLNDQGLLPGQTPLTGFATATPAGHPYSGAPWNHSTSTGAGFGDADYVSDVTDWVLVELRSGFDASTEICTHAGFVHSDGTVTFPDNCGCNVLPGDKVHIVIKHRNHVPIISPLVTVDNTGQASFDFRIQDSFRASPFDVGQIALPGGIFAMVAANGDQTVLPTSQADVETNDKQVWLDRNSDNDMYSPADYDMNGDVNSNDKFVWLKNNLTSGTLID